MSLHSLFFFFDIYGNARERAHKKGKYISSTEYSIFFTFFYKILICGIVESSLFYFKCKRIYPLL